jgi:hypothetical protein
VNKKLAYPTSTSVSAVSFTPDSQHLYWLASEKTAERPQPFWVLYVDGQPAVKLNSDPFMSAKGAWEMGRDGVLTFAAVVGDVVKRHRVAPSPELNVEKMTARAEEMQARAIADAAAAKKKAEEEKLAAQQKAAAEAATAAAKKKADAEAAAAARKKAYDDAVAAKLKARQDALEARKKAAAEAAAARAAARQKK